MEAKDKVDLAIRSGLVAKSILQLMDCNNKILAKMIMAEAIELMTDLDKKIKTINE